MDLSKGSSLWTTRGGILCEWTLKLPSIHALGNKVASMSDQVTQRRRQFVDRRVQGILILHVVGHWMLFLLATGALLFFVELLSGDPRDAWKNTLHRHGPTMFAVLVLAPIFIRDILRLSSRFAGPMARLRRAMCDLAEGRDVSPIKLRQRDFWDDFAADFNRVVQQVQGSTTFADDVPSHPSESRSHDEVEGLAAAAGHTCES